MSIELLGTALRHLPAFRGKARLARLFMNDISLSRSYTFQDKKGDWYSVPNLVEPVGFHLFVHGMYEPETFHVIKNACRTGGSFVDVGANIGALTIPVARHLADKAKVIAVEASPRIAEILAYNIKMNGLQNVQLSRCAAGRNQGTTEFYVPPESHFGMGSMSPQFNSAPTTIPMMSLDSLLEASGADRVAAIKIDVEGHEADVIEGATTVLSQRPAPLVIFEFCDWAEERAYPGDVGRAQRLLMELGFKVLKMDSFLKASSPLSSPLQSGTEMLIGYKHE